MIDRARALIAAIEGGKKPQLDREVLPVLQWLTEEVSQYAEVSNAMRQAAWRDHSGCDIPYTKIYQVMKDAQ